MDELPLIDRTILITGAARRIGRSLALSCARAGANIVIHYGHAAEAARETKQEIEMLGRQAWTIQADLSQPGEVDRLTTQVGQTGELYGLVNCAAIFNPATFQDTTLSDWNRHLAINLTAPFLLSQYFAEQIPWGAEGRIVNILDWRALRPGVDHFPYTISKAALAALTESLAMTLAPRITVNGLALGAILPPSGQPASADVIKNTPAGRWAQPDELEQAFLFLLTGPAYITGEIIHVDGGRHLV